MWRSVTGWPTAALICAWEQWARRRISRCLAGCGSGCLRISTCGSIRWTGWGAPIRRRRSVPFWSWILFSDWNAVVRLRTLPCAATDVSWRPTAGSVPAISAGSKRETGIRVNRRKFSGPCAAKRGAPVIWPMAGGPISRGGSFSGLIRSFGFRNRIRRSFWIWTVRWCRRNTGEDCRTACAVSCLPCGKSALFFWLRPCRQRKSGRGWEKIWSCFRGLSLRPELMCG